MLGVAYKPGVGDMRESPGAEDHRAAARAAARDLVYHDPHVPELPQFEAAQRATSTTALDGGRPGRDRHRPPRARPRAGRARRAAGGRPPRRHARHRRAERGAALSGRRGPRRRRRARLLGPEPGAQLRRRCRAASCAGCATPPSRRASAVGPALRARAPDGRPRRAAGRPRARRGGRGHARAHARRAGRARARGGQALLRREAAGAVRGRRASAWSRPPRAAGRVLMVGHLLEYHPGVRSLKEIADSGELGDIRYIYSNRLNLGVLRERGERALEPRRARRLRAAALLAGEEPHEVEARGESYMQRGGRGRRLLLPALPVRACRPPAPVVARPAQGAPLHRRRLQADGDASTTWSSSAR